MEINYSWSNPPLPYQASAASRARAVPSIDPASRRNPGCAHGLGQGHTLVPLFTRARILGCCLVLRTELCAPCLLVQPWQDVHPLASTCTAQPVGQDLLSWV